VASKPRRPPSRERILLGAGSRRGCGALSGAPRAPKTIVDKQRAGNSDKERRASRILAAICAAVHPRAIAKRAYRPREDVPAAQRDSQAPAWPSDVIGEPGSSSSTRHSVSPRRSRRLHESFRGGAPPTDRHRGPTFARIETTGIDPYHGGTLLTVGSRRHASCASLNRRRSFTRVNAGLLRCAYARRRCVGHHRTRRGETQREDVAEADGNEKEEDSLARSIDRSIDRSIIGDPRRSEITLRVVIGNTCDRTERPRSIPERSTQGCAPGEAGVRDSSLNPPPNRKSVSP